MALEAPLSFQLYSARNFPPLDAELKIVADAGFTNVETYGAFYDDVDGSAALLKRYGLTAKSGHFGLAALESDPKSVITIARKFGMDTVIVPYLGPDERPGDRAGWVSVGERLAKAAAAVRREGLGFAWHNHDFEFRALPDGSLPIEHLLAEGVDWEADLAWIVRGGADPKPWLSRYAGRVPLIHVKDIAPAGENAAEEGWADVGAGTLPWQDYWDLAVASGARIMVAEHDNPSDLARFATTSAAAMRRFNERKGR
jgi:sugar phosphate isomerase/epimerase